MDKMMGLEERIVVLKALGEYLRKRDERLQAVMAKSLYHNAWFTLENQEKAIRAIESAFLDEHKLLQWLSRYEIVDGNSPKTVGLVLAGNLPLVGFHDVLCVFAAGHKALIKYSDKDQYLLPHLLDVLGELDDRTKSYFEKAERLHGFDAVIATGSNNSARYFEAYFGKYPHIIRKNRNAVAVLTGRESREDLLALGLDVFTYFGLGCRNVSKLYLPRGYDFDPFLEALHEYREIVLHDKYKHNFDYNYALYIINRVAYKANGCILLIEDPRIPSRIAELHYEYYDTLDQVKMDLDLRQEEIQCVVGSPDLLNFPVVPFGKGQEPELWEYADGVDAMQFLLTL